MLLSLLFATFAAFNFTTQPSAGQYVLVQEDGGRQMVVDLFRVEQDGDFRRVRIIAISGPDAGVGRVLAVYPYEVECGSNRARVTQYAGYDEQLKHLQTRDAEDPAWFDVQPNTPIADVVGYVCRGVSPSQPAPDLLAYAQAYWREKNVAP